MSHKVIAADITNVGLLHAATERLLGRPQGAEGMAVMFGPSGFGKTQSATQAYLRHNGYFVRMSDQWTCKTLLQKILLEMDIRPESTSAAMLDQVAQQLSASGRPLIIDEADYAADKPRLLQLIRDIHDNAYRASLILIGEEALPQKLAKYERFYSRVLCWLPAQPVSLEDARQLAPLYTARDVSKIAPYSGTEIVQVGTMLAKAGVKPEAIFGPRGAAFAVSELAITAKEDPNRVSEVLGKLGEQYSWQPKDYKHGADWISRAETMTPGHFDELTYVLREFGEQAYAKKINFSDSATMASLMAPLGLQGGTAINRFLIDSMGISTRKRK